MKTYIILVAGNDFSNGGVNFSYLADKRRSDLISRNPSWEDDPEVIFVRMDVKAGKIERNAHDGSRRVWSVESDAFTPVKRSAHYRDNHFVTADTAVMSITDCYRYVINIGNKEPGTVKEFSILSHGWFGGPVIINSFQRPEFSNGGLQAAERDPWDKDGRTKDFFKENISDDDWKSFKSAFASDGYSWFWGCLFSRAYYDTLYKIMHTDAFRSKVMGNHEDEDVFTISVTQAFVTNYYYVDPLFFPADNNERTFTRSLFEIKKFLKRGLKRSYPGRFALDTGINCLAACLGTYADYERSYGGHTPAHTVMIIPRNTAVYGTDFTRTIDFFKIYLDMPEDPENRGYGGYQSSLVSRWWADTL